MNTLSQLVRSFACRLHPTRVRFATRKRLGVAWVGALAIAVVTPSLAAQAGTVSAAKRKPVVLGAALGQAAATAHAAMRGQGRSLGPTNPLLQGTNGVGDRPGTQSANFASIRPLSFYHPFGPTGVVQVPYWKQHMRNSGGAFEFVVQLSQPAGPAGVDVDFDWGGTAEEGVHYATAVTSPLHFAPGATEASISVDALPSNEYFKERFLQLELIVARNASIDFEHAAGQLWIRPSVDPPTISFPEPITLLAPGTFARVPVRLSHPSQEDVTLHYSIVDASNLTDYAFGESGSVVFRPGQLVNNLLFSSGFSAQPGQRLLLKIRHERNEVDYVIPALDSNLSSASHLHPQNVHVDENLWTHSIGGVQVFEEHDLRTPPRVGRAMPGVPSDNLTGGSFWEPGMFDRELIDLLDQQNPIPLLDPFNGLPLKIFAISEAATGPVPYLRKSFNGAFCGSNTQLYELPPYLRISFYVALPQGPDQFRGVPFVRAGMRVRSLDLNHGVTFRIGSQGLDAGGNPVNVVQTQLGDIGVWDTFEVDDQTDRYGVVEDEYGVRFWYAHKLDPTFGWVHPTQGDIRFELPGVHKGNPIEYPTWVSTADGSLAAMGVNSMDELTGFGNMPYGFQWEISNDDSIFGGDLTPYFPKPGNWWEPVGNAVIEAETSLLFVIQ